MKKILFLSFLFLTINFTLNSQIYLGFSGGVNAAGIRFDNDVQQNGFRKIDKPRYGYKAGLTGDFYFAKVLAVQVDLDYTLKGFAYELTYSEGYKIFNYGQISAAGKIDLNPDSKVIVSPFLAPYAAYWISGKRMQSDYKTGIIDIDKIYLSGDTTFAYNRYDIGIIAGINFKFEQPNHRYFELGIRYEQGMISTDIEKVDGWRNKNLSIYFRYVYRVKK